MFRNLILIAIVLTAGPSQAGSLQTKVQEIGKKYAAQRVIINGKSYPNMQTYKDLYKYYPEKIEKPKNAEYYMIMNNARKLRSVHPLDRPALQDKMTRDSLIRRQDNSMIDLPPSPGS